MQRGGNRKGVGVQKALHLNQVLKTGKKEARRKDIIRLRENHMNQSLQVGKLRPSVRWDLGKESWCQIAENL